MNQHVTATPHRALRFVGLTLCASMMFIAQTSFAATSVGANADGLNSWLSSQTIYSTRAMLANIGPSAEIPDAAPGSVVASPSYDPYYRYYWVRDGALTMDTVVDLYEKAATASEQAHYYELLMNYVTFSRQNQLTSNPSGGPDSLGLGEPKFNVDGSAFTGPWARPQNDGPALRARTLIRFAHILLNKGRSDLVRSQLFDNSLPTHSVIKADLEFVAHHWRDSSFDLWEEVQGDHFYTRLTQRRALVEGADLAQGLGDGGAAQWYRSQATEIERELLKHWDDDRGFLTVTLNRTAGLDYKWSGLDVAIVLGALHAAPVPEGYQTSDLFFDITDDRVLMTAEKISAAFKTVYSINARDRDSTNYFMSPGIGRYPEDRYAGVEGSDRGNPWFLGTNAFAEMYYRLANHWEARGAIDVTARNLSTLRRLTPQRQVSVRPGEVITSKDRRFAAVIQSLRDEGDSYLRRSRFHADPTGPISEQFNRDTGYMQSARELTWSHASVLTAAWVRNR